MRGKDRQNDLKAAAQMVPPIDPSRNTGRTWRKILAALIEVSEGKTVIIGVNGAVYARHEFRSILSAVIEMWGARVVTLADHTKREIRFEWGGMLCVKTAEDLSLMHPFEARGIELVYDHDYEG